MDTQMWRNRNVGKAIAPPVLPAVNPKPMSIYAKLMDAAGKR
jgi:hypothetical protein